MNLSENLNNSFNYAKKLFSDVGRLIILIVLDLPFLFVVNWLVAWLCGQSSKGVAWIRNSSQDLRNMERLFVNGAKVFFASLIYMIIPTILIAAGGVSFFAGLLSGEVPSMVLGGTAVVLVLVGIILAIILLIILGVGIAHMVKSGRFGKAFAFGEIFSIIRGIGWGRYLGWIVLVIVIAAVVGAISGAVPYVGWIVSAIISPVLSVFIFRSLGLLYNDGAPPELRAQAGPSAIGGLACASCGTPLQPYHKYCPSCGAPAPAPPTPAPPSTTETGTKFCISCGAKIPAGAKLLRKLWCQANLDLPTFFLRQLPPISSIEHVRDS